MNGPIHPLQNTQRFNKETLELGSKGSNLTPGTISYTFLDKLLHSSKPELSKLESASQIQPPLFIYICLMATFVPEKQSRNCGGNHRAMKPEIQSCIPYSQGVRCNPLANA